MYIIIAILGIIVASVSCYSLLTGENVTLPYMQILLGVMLLLLGWSQLKEKRKGLAIFLFIVAAFSIFINVIILLR
ncbi:hypothetical protein CSV80_15980 [Sporosarcina sp. P12(2017)]|uniref:DUF3953 domain-containing protein n=1 Tax=Sporosarcina sp. P12(2017) TaxID=2048561 RepID=UPI000C1721AC|nr:hypothetical protein CSV81_07145 [Sporosarcina sp. P10]PIC59425.1 hypothetical protein CSV80_15980 [Sporosarcina sp. P12(2017)]